MIDTYEVPDARRDQDAIQQRPVSSPSKPRANPSLVYGLMPLFRCYLSTRETCGQTRFFSDRKDDSHLVTEYEEENGKEAKATSLCD